MDKDDLLQELIDANNRSHEQLVSMVSKLDRKSDQYLENQVEMKEEIHVLVTNQANIMEDVIEIKDKVKDLEKEKLKNHEDRITALENMKEKKTHFWETNEKYFTRAALFAGIVYTAIKIAQHFGVF